MYCLILLITIKKLILLRFILFNSLTDLLILIPFFYRTQWSSWATTMFLVAISTWYLFTVVNYCYTVSRRRQMARQYAHFDGEGAQDMPSAV